MAGIRFGVDQLVEHPPAALREARCGMLTNDAAVTAALPRLLAPTRAAMLHAGVRLTALFSPEHGLAVSAADGAHVGDARDPMTGLPVHSLYGDAFTPTAEALDGIDVMLADLPDIGARSYTYAWTLSHVLEACTEASKPVWVLDRPNPLGGLMRHVEGPVLDDTVPPSLVGRWPGPARHSLTLGELARHWVRTRAIGVDLLVVQTAGWRRGMRWPVTGLPFVPASPAMPSYETALLYPGTCLLEGVNLSEGRGTSTPFRVAGAPWLDGTAVTEAFNGLGLPGVAARPSAFTPSAGKHAGEPCGGVMLHVLDEDVFRPVATGLHLLRAVRDVHPDRFAFADYGTAANPPGRHHFDRLVGTAAVRPALLDPTAAFHALVDAWTSPGDWAERVAPDLLYGE